MRQKEREAMLEVMEVYARAQGHWEALKRSEESVRMCSCSCAIRDALLAAGVDAKVIHERKSAAYQDGLNGADSDGIDGVKRVIHHESV